MLHLRATNNYFDTTRIALSVEEKKKPLSIMRGSSRPGHGGSARGALSRASRVPELRVQEDEEEQAAMSDMSIDYLE